MHQLRRQNRFNRIILLALVLLVSNIAAMSCAMAYEFCADCPDHAPVLCIDSCATTEATIASDHSSEIMPDTFRPIHTSNYASPVDARFESNQFPLINSHPPDPHTAPPRHLQFCVFLK
jgi:hypothetical protein